MLPDGLGNDKLYNDILDALSKKPRNNPDIIALLLALENLQKQKLNVKNSVKNSNFLVTRFCYNFDK